MKKIFIGVAVIVAMLTSISQANAETPAPSYSVTASCSTGLSVDLVGYGYGGNIIVSPQKDYIPVDESITRTHYNEAFAQNGKKVTWKVSVTGTANDFTKTGSIKCGSTKPPKKPKTIYKQFAEFSVICSIHKTQVRVFEQKQGWYLDTYANVWLPDYSGTYEKSVTQYEATADQCP